MRTDSIIALMAANMGIALMMERLADFCEHPGVVVVPLEQTIASRIVVAYPKDGKLSDLARIFLDSIGQANSAREAEA